MYFDCKNPANGVAGNANPAMERLLVLNKVIRFPYPQVFAIVCMKLAAYQINGLNWNRGA
jgi:hypothetical protein